jgi:transposase
MARMTRRLVSDVLWARVEPHLPMRAPQPKGGRPWANDRDCLEGVLWVLRSGARWADVPVDLPSPSTCWRRLQEWAGEGCLDAIQAAVVEELDELGHLDWDQLVADATFVRGKKGAMRSATPSAAKG